MELPSLKTFSLVGGTSLALKYGHRSSLEQLMAFHKKYPSQMLPISIPNAITYFVDAEESETPVCFKTQTWEGIKKGISKAVRDYLS
jgi:hypothetical protein